jgi:hypothetical protein
MNSGVYTTWMVDTSPGGRGPFAPPPEWSGHDDDYVELMRQRWRDPTLAQDFHAVVNCDTYHEPEYSGPYNEVAEKIRNKIKNDLAKKRRSHQP